MRRLPAGGGLYTIDPFDPMAGRARRPDTYDAMVTIVGLGGTGAFLAEDLAHLLGVHFGWRVRLTLVDHDRVEAHNERRQAFTHGDRQRFKAQVVAERLVRQFPLEIALSLAPYDHDRDAPRPQRGDPPPRLSLLIGCVDNANARRELARTLESDTYRGPVWWLDLGNSALLDRSFWAARSDPATSEAPSTSRRTPVGRCQPLRCRLPNCSRRPPLRSLPPTRIVPRHSSPAIRSRS